jgi:hypothetical protein
VTEQFLDEMLIEAPAQDEGDLDAEGLVAEELPADHDLDVDAFEEEDDS